MKCSNKSCKEILASDYAYKTCASCREKDRTKKQRIRLERVIAQKCIQCSNLLLASENVSCERCVEKKKLYDQEYHTQSHRAALWNKSRELLQGAKTRADEEGVKFDLTTDFIYELLARGTCEVTRLPVVWSPEMQGVRGPWSPTLDRWNPQIFDYTQENTKLTVWAFNVFKYRWETKDWCYLLRHCLRAFGIIDKITDEIDPKHTMNSQITLARKMEFDRSKMDSWYYQAKVRAEKDGGRIDFTRAEIEEIIRGGFCQVTGIPFDFSGLQQPDFTILGNPRASALAVLLGPKLLPLVNLPPTVAPSDGLDYNEVTPLTPQRLKKRDSAYNPWIPSIHRINPEIRDYTKNNTQFVCWAYNAAKTNFSDEDFKILLTILGKRLGLIQDPDVELLTLPPAIEKLKPDISVIVEPSLTVAKDKLLGYPKRKPASEPEQKLAPDQKSTAPEFKEKSGEQLMAQYKKFYPHLDDAALLIEAQKVERIKRELLGKKS